MREAARPGPVTLYYLATPLFAGVDALLGEPIRVAALGAWELPVRVAAGGPAELAFDTAHVWNVGIVGMALVVSIKRAEGELHTVFGFGSRDGSTNL